MAAPRLPQPGGTGARLAPPSRPAPSPRLAPPPVEPAALAAPRAESGPFRTEIAFAGASRALPADAEPALTRIVDRLKAEPGLKVRLSGAAAASDGKSARELALARALAVQRYLLSRGVMSDAIMVDPVSGEDARNAVAVRLVVPA